jgi:hypothetical protein
MAAFDLRTVASELPFTPLDLAFADFSAASPCPATTCAMPGWQPCCQPTSLAVGTPAWTWINLLRQNGVQDPGLEQRPAGGLATADLEAATVSLPWTCGADSPLVLEASRLYLRRNWLAEHRIRASIAARLSQPCPVPEDPGTGLE